MPNILDRKSTDQKSMIEYLNLMLTQEHACAIRYATHAAVVAGPYAESVRARLKEISDDEWNHASILRDRIIALGGKPSMGLNKEDLKYETSLEKILQVNINEEKRAIQDYAGILKQVSPGNSILFLAIQDIIRDEQEHLEELEALKETQQ